MHMHVDVAAVKPLLPVGPGPAVVLMVTTPNVLVDVWWAIRRGCSPRGTVLM